jgi:diguanylate cyclase (GGDEF)-like protein
VTRTRAPLRPNRLAGAGIALLLAALVGASVLTFGVLLRLDDDVRRAATARGTFHGALGEFDRVVRAHAEGHEQAGDGGRAAALAGLRRRHARGRALLARAGATFGPGAPEAGAVADVERRFDAWYEASRREAGGSATTGVASAHDLQHRVERSVQDAHDVAKRREETGRAGARGALGRALTLLGMTLVTLILLAAALAASLVAWSRLLGATRDRLDRRARQQAILAELGGQLVVSRWNRDDLVGHVLDGARRALDVEEASFLEPRDDGAFDASVGEASGTSRPAVAPAADAARARCAMQVDEAVVMDDAAGRASCCPLPARDGESSLSAAVLQDRVPHGALIVRAEPGRVFGEDDANVLRALASVLGAGLDRVAAEQALQRLALTDPLTGLPNHELFLRRVDEAIAAPVATPAVVFVDLDRFQDVNDAHGHAVGDALLAAVAARLRGGFGDGVARLGGDEFGVVVDTCDGDESALGVVERAMFLFADPFDVDGVPHTLTASLGVALHRTEVRGAEELLRDAHNAVRRAKARGPASFEILEPEARRALLARQTLRDELRGALDRGELHLAYQPIVDLRSGHVVHVEALLRWAHPTRGPISPAEFIPIAESSGLIDPIGRWVLGEACRQTARWQRECPDVEAIGVTVNVSAVQIVQSGFWQGVHDVLDATGVDPELLGLELTESAIMQHAALMEGVHALRERGCRLLLDDFGTGYSSLSYLRSFPVDVLKIDRSFVGGVGQELQDSAIVAATVSMAHSLGVRVVAEGVETPSQAAHLEVVRCDYAQGFYFSPPVPADAVTGLRRRLALRAVA